MSRPRAAVFRRARFRAALIVGVVLVQVLAAGAGADARTAVDEWPRQYFDLHNTSFNPYERAISPATAPTLALSWARQVTSQTSERSGPIVLDGRVYIGTDGSVEAFVASTGHRLWSVSVGARTGTTGLAVSGGLLYVTDVLQHAVYALDRGTGELVWRNDETGGTAFPVVVGDDLIYTVDNGPVVAVDAATGALRWSTRLQGNLPSFPAVDGSTLYVGDDAGFFYAIDVLTGVILWRWRCPANGRVAEDVSFAHGIAYISVDPFNLSGVLYAIDTRTHAPRWHVRFGGPLSTAPSIAGHVLYVVAETRAGATTGILYALRARGGAILWTRPIGLSTAPTIANGVVFAGGVNGPVEAFDAATGAELWSFTGVDAAKVAVADGRVYFGDARWMYSFGTVPPP